MNLGETYDMGFDMDFEDGFISTEDFFDFFDRPSGGGRAFWPIAPSLEESSGLPPAGSAPIGFSPLILGDGAFSVTTTFALGQQQPSPFSASGTADPFTPRFPEMYHVQDLVPTGADIVLPSPGSTPNSAPTTPQVKLSLEHTRRPVIQSNFFEPIPFAHSHRLSNSKYRMGKFGLPSPPDEED